MDLETTDMAIVTPLREVSGTRDLKPNTDVSDTLPDQPLVVIESTESGVQMNLGDLWRYRELLYFFTWRDIKVRYKQTLMGAAWVVVQPLATMILFTLFFNRFAGLNSGDMPYPLFAYSGLLLWTFFANAVTNATTSLLSNTNLLTKVYFPRLFVPAASVAAGLFDLIVASVILIPLFIYYGIKPSFTILLFPFFVALATTLAFSIGTLVSAATVKYRDLRHALPFSIQLWMFASPVIYPSNIIPAKWSWFLIFNPMTGILEGFRSAIFGRHLDWAAIAIAAGMAVILLLVSVYVFRKTEDTFADII